MTKPKFTPGPWNVVLAADYNSRIAIAAKGAEKYSSRGPIALVGKRHKASIANANLIAAAPEMYEALFQFTYSSCKVCNYNHCGSYDFVEKHEFLSQGCKFADNKDCFERKVLEILRKARGESEVSG